MSRADAATTGHHRALETAVLVTVPLALGLCARFQVDQSALLTVAVAGVAVLIQLGSFDRSRPALRTLMPIVVLAALAAAGRILFAAIPDVKPVTAICILAGAVLGRRSGFMVGALAALVSNFFFGQGLWTPWQMYSWGLVGYLSGVLSAHGLLSRRCAVLVWGFASALVYGFILNSWYLVGYVHPITWESALIAYGAGFALDIVHATATVAFLLLIYLPWSRKLDRIKRKYALFDA